MIDRFHEFSMVQCRHGHQGVNQADADFFDAACLSFHAIEQVRLFVFYGARNRAPVTHDGPQGGRWFAIELAKAMSDDRAQKRTGKKSTMKYSMAAKGAAAGGGRSMRVSAGPR
jgi:hypothetical protein